MSADDQKRAAGEAAAALVADGMTVGLGTGSTAAYFVRALAARRPSIRAVPTSSVTAELARGLGIEVIDLDDAGTIDLTVDGADEIAPNLDVIKGAGGALLREKLVWLASRKCVVIADESKRVRALGECPLPIEVIAFGHVATARRIAAVLSHWRLGAEPRLRLAQGAPWRTDGGNFIYDAACGPIEDPRALACSLKAISGVVEHGLFVGLGTAALIGTEAGVEMIGPAA